VFKKIAKTVSFLLSDYSGSYQKNLLAIRQIKQLSSLQPSKRFWQS